MSKADKLITKILLMFYNVSVKTVRLFIVAIEKY